MSSEYRETRLSIDLGEEEVEFVSLTATESISEPFTIECQIASPYGELDLATHLGKPVSLTVFEDDEKVRYFNGLMTEANYLRESADGFIYSLKLNSFLYFLNSRTGYAIFQSKSVVDVIKDVFSGAGITDFEFRISENYTPYEYCVQYGETDLSFISRLMEQEGMYYFFEHFVDKHVLVVCDRNTNHNESLVAGLAFNPTADVSQSYRVASEWGERHYLKRWTEKLVTTGEETVSLRDFDFEKPKKPVEAKATGEAMHSGDNEEYYAYPGLFKEAGRGEHLSRIKLEKIRAHRHTYLAETTAKGMCLGTTINVANHPNNRFNADYFITSTVHVLQSQSYRSGTGSLDSDEVHFVAIPKDVQYRAPQKTPKPRVIGIESAVVTGPSGETIYTDKYGRIKVRFHWDRSKTAGENTTCWIRVSQTGGLGNIILPRVGHEVLVNFLNGDPDRPVVVGRVFNGENKPVYDLPANKTRAVWRTKTYGEQGQYPETEALDTGKPKANEIRFEDKGGSEEVFIHAERDMNTRVRFDSSHHIGHDEEREVGHDRQRYVKNDEKVTIDGNKTYILKKNEKNTIESGNRTTTLNKGNDSLKLKQGNIKVNADMGKITIEAQQSIELKVGSTVLKLTPVGATLESTMVNIKGKGMTTIEAGGILTEKGALIKIN